MINIKNNPLISVIVPVYKIESYIEICIDSLLNQTYRNLEILLIDDGSPDSCGEICEQYAKIDTRIRVIHKLNGGLSDARNYGMKEAKGELLSFIDGDDYIYKHFYEILVSEMKRANCDVVECFSIKFEDGDSPKAIIDKTLTELTPKEWLTESNLGEFISCVVWNKLYKRSLFDGILFPVGLHYEDEATTYKVIYKANKILRVHSALYFYRQRVGSITQRENSIKVINEQFQALEERVNYFKACNEQVIARFSLAKLGIYMISVYGRRKKITGKSRDWYLYISKILIEISFDFTIPLKYRLYIFAFLNFPFMFCK